MKFLLTGAIFFYSISFQYGLSLRKLDVEAFITKNPLTGAGNIAGSESFWNERFFLFGLWEKLLLPDKYARNASLSRSSDPTCSKLLLNGHFISVRTPKQTKIRTAGLQPVRC
jgi:hypothetical protein